MPEPQTPRKPRKPRKPPVIKPNATGVVEFAGYLNSIGQDGNAVLRKFNKEAKAGTAARLVDPLQKLADSYNWQGNLFSGDSVAVPVVTNQPAKAAQAPAPVSQETNTLAEVGKSSWNGLLDVVTGAARTPQILHSVASTILDAIGHTQSEEEKKDSEVWSGRLQGLAEATSGFMSNFKATVDASGQYDHGLIEKDEQGNYKWNGLSGAAHMIGNSLGFLGSMALGGTVTKGARLLQGTATALKVAKAAGNVAEVAAITNRMQKTDRAIRYVTGMMSQLEPTYQEAYRSMQDPDKASLFSAVVTPVVAAVDAFTGGEAAMFGGRKLLAGKVAKQVLKEMAGKELTQESFGVAAKKVAQSYLKEVVKGGAKIGAEEMGTEVIQEGYTAMMESIFDLDADSKDFSNNDMPLDVRLLNAGMLGGMLGHVTGTTMQAFQQIGAYEPLAFRSLHQAYKEGGATALEDQGATLSSSLDKMVRSGEMTEAGAAQVSEQLSRMKNIISSAKNPYTASPESQFQLYDVYYNHAPAQAEILTDLTDRASALQGETPVRFQSAEDGSIVRNELGEPQVEAYIDPAVAEVERVGLEKDLINQNRRVEYIKSVQAQLINTGNSINYVKGLSVIGRFDEGDTVVATGLDRKKVSGRVVSVSNTGQELTLAVAPDEEGNPQQITVKAIETKPDSPAINPVVSIPVDAALADGFTPHETINADNRPYQEGDFIVLKENPADPVEVVGSQVNDKGETVLTVADESGVRDVVVNGSDPDVLGLYDPNKALQAAEARQQQKVADTKRKQLEAKIDPAIVKAVKLMSPQAIAQRWLSFEGVAGKETERSYLEMVAADKGVDVKAPVSEQTDTTPTITGNQDEVIDDATWEQIDITGEVPMPILSSMAARILSGEAFTSRQQNLFDIFIQEDADELKLIDNLLDILADSQAGPIETTQEVTPLSAQSTQDITQPVNKEETQTNTQEAKQSSVTQTPAQPVQKISDSVGKVVLFKGKPYLIEKEGVRYVLSSDSTIIELQADDDTTLSDLRLEEKTEKSYKVTYVSDSEIDVDGVLYQINTTPSGAVISLSPLNNPSQQIKNEKLLVSVEIERNKQEYVQAKSITEEAYQGILSSVDEAKVLESIYSLNMTDSVSTALDKLYNDETLTDQEQLSIDVWVTDASIRVSARYVKTNNNIYANALDNLELISETLYGKYKKSEPKGSNQVNGSNGNTKRRFSQGDISATERANRKKQKQINNEEGSNNKKPESIANESKGSDPRSSGSATGSGEVSSLSANPGSVVGDVANGTGQPTDGASANSSPTGEVAQSGTPAGTDSSTSVAEVLSDAERDRLISGKVTGSEYDNTVLIAWPQQVASGQPLSANQSAVLSAASPYERVQFQERVDQFAKRIADSQPIGRPVATVGQDVIATLNSGTQTVGKVISFEDGDAWVEHLDRKGKKTTMSRIGPGNLVDKATKTALDIPKQQRASSLAELSKEALGKLVTKLRQNFPRIQVSLLSDAEMRTMFNISEDQQLYGAVRDGVVYLNADKAKADTPIHEFAHLYAETLKKHHPQFYQRGLSLVRGSNYESQVRVNYPELTSEEAILEEALVQAIGEKGASLATPSKARQFMQWLKNILAKLGEAIGIELTPETTLDAFIEARAKELLSGNTLAEITGEQEGTRLAKVVLPPLTTPVPAVMDEATLASYSLDEKQKAELAKKSVIWDEATDSYTREAVDEIAEGNEIASNIAKLRASGQAIKAIVGRANVLDVANIGRVLFGDSAFGQQWQGMLESGRRRVAPMKVSGHDFIAASFETLKGKTIYRGVSSLDSVTKWNVDVEVDGIDQQISLTPDVAISLAAQYKSMMADYGHFDPDHRDKVKAGVEPQLEAEILNPADPTKELVVKLNKQQLDDLYDLVFHNDPEIADLTERWVSHSDGIFDKVARVFTLMQGGQLGKANWYYPISSASTEAQLNQRDIQRFVDDASQLRTRQGAPKRIRAYGFLSDVSRYQRDAENYVQLSPIWQNIDKLLARQSGTFINADMKSVKSALETLRDSFATPEASRNNRNFSAAFDWDFGKLMRLATLSRFAFNLAIPIKQITGYFSAFGNGLIDNKYLTAELANYGKMIGESYWLIGRGSEEGNYSGGATSFDEGVAELRSIDDPNAQALLWRLLGSGNPDIQFDDWSKIKDLAAGREMFAGKMRAFFEEYGLNVTHRADVAVVLSLYNAAKAQVVETQPSMPADEQQKEAARLAKEALYYSNSTYDKTDRTPLQLSANLITQMLLLYKSHNMKIYNTLARRSIEYGQADAAGKPAAKAALAGNMALNMVLAPVITTLIDYGVKNLRDLTKDEKDKKELTPEETAKQLVFNLFAQIAQVAPAELGDAGGYIFSKWANPQSPRELLDSRPFGTVVDLMESAWRTGATYTNTEYNSKEQFEENRTRALQQLLRTTATRFGIPMEVVRQANNGIATMLLPEKKESRSRGRGRGEQDGALGIEFELGLQERTGRGR